MGAFLEEYLVLLSESMILCENIFTAPPRQMVRDGAFSQKIDWVRNFLKILNLKGHQNHNIGSKVTALLLNWLVLPVGGVALGRVCTCSLRMRLVFF